MISKKLPQGNEKSHALKSQLSLFEPKNPNNLETSNPSVLPTGLELKREALERFEIMRAEYLLRARHVFIQILLENGTCTLDDVRAVLEVPPEINPSVNGAVPKLPAFIAIDAFVISDRPKARAHRIARWKLISREKALQWLSDNPLSMDTSQQGVAQ